MAPPVDMQEFKEKFRQLRDELNRWNNTKKMDLDTSNYNDIKNLDALALVAIGATDIEAAYYAVKISIIKTFITVNRTKYADVMAGLEELIIHLP
jgi:phage-related tail protein